MLLEKNGPDPCDYDRLTDAVNSIQLDRIQNKIKPKEVEALFAKMSPLFTIDSMIGHTYLKPYGYNGDFEILEKFYDYRISSNPFCKKWDIYTQQLGASKAVRNRVNYFKDAMRQIILRLENSQAEFRILNLASGPSRIIYNFLTELNESRPDLINRIRIDCIDLDEHAIAFSKKRMRKFLNQVSYKKVNVFKFLPEHQYDIIWSSGLFDYFDDTTFVKLLSRFYGYLYEGGQMIIGNFKTGTASRSYMELFEWYLNYRSEQDLIDFAKEVISKSDEVFVEQEKAGVNLFLNIIKD